MKTPTKLILIADGLEGAARMLGERVERQTDYDTVAAQDAQQAMEQAELRRPDAAILDVDVPRLDGLGAARRLRDRFGERRPLLIATTCGDAYELNFSGLFDHVLKKPVAMDDLLPKLAQS